jgi:hypothetical protein
MLYSAAREHRRRGWGIYGFRPDIQSYQHRGVRMGPGNCRDIRHGEPDDRIASGPIFNSSELRLDKDRHVASSGRHDSLNPEQVRGLSHDYCLARRSDWL